MTILFDSNQLDNIFTILFGLQNQQKVAQTLIEFLKIKRVVSKSDLSNFAQLLNDGKMKELSEFEEIQELTEFDIDIKYNRKQFYSRILNPMLKMGLVNLGYYDKKYRLSREFIDSLTKIASLWEKKIEKQQV